jgi:hypothetical protein
MGVKRRLSHRDGRMAKDIEDKVFTRKFRGETSWNTTTLKTNATVR